MSWFSGFVPAGLSGSGSAEAPAEEEPEIGRAVKVAPPDLTAAGLPVEQNNSGRPRAKVAAKGRLLPKWEANSEDGDVDDRDDPDDESSPMASAGAARMELGEDDVAKSGAIAHIRLKSYEESVLQLKDPRAKTKRSGHDAGDDDDKDGLDTFRSSNSQKAATDLKFREKMLEEEKTLKELDAHKDNASGVNALSASRVIVGVAKVKLNMMKQKMKLYEEAEFSGTDANLRSRKLLTWMALLSFLRKFDIKMLDPDIKELKRMEYLNKLEPPPPPPPPEEPPDSEDEELHDKYEAMIRRYEMAWQREGQRVLGKEKFKEIQNMHRNGPAAREKTEIAVKCLEQAKHVMNETEYQELLRKAWRLQDDHADLGEYDPREFANKVANSGGAPAMRK